MRRYVILAISLFLATLFVATIGSMYTGYAVIKKENIGLEHYPYPFIKNNVYNGFKIVLPERYSVDELNAAKSLARSLQKNRPLPPEIVFATTRFTPGHKQLTKWDEQNGNLILIGDTCTNYVIGSHIKSGNDGCTFRLKTGEGYIRLINEANSVGGYRTVLILSGYDLKSELNAIKVMENYNMFPLKYDLVRVQGGYSNSLTGLRLSISKSQA